MFQLLKESVLASKSCFRETKIDACLLKDMGREETEAGQVKHKRRSTSTRPRVRVPIFGITSLEVKDMQLE